MKQDIKLINLVLFEEKYMWKKKRVKIIYYIQIIYVGILMEVLGLIRYTVIAKQAVIPK